MPLLEKLKSFYRSDSFWAGLLRDVLFVIAVLVVFSSFFHITLGLWVPFVAVESDSMVPHIQIGDYIIMESAYRKEVITYMAGKESNYKSFDSYGDVILYKPYGQEGVTPIIHRAMYFVEKGEAMWNEGPSAPHAGYITKGDNSKTNPSFDQQVSISYLQPVKKEWVIGMARFVRVPFLGCVSLTARGNFACFKRNL